MRFRDTFLMLSRRELLVLGLVFAASLPAVTARLYSSDEVEYFSYLRSLWFDRDVSFENEYRYFYDHNIAQSASFHETFLERETPAGRRINYGTIGCAILWAPFYGVADLVTRAWGGSAPADGFSTPYVAAVAYGSAFYAFAAILLSIGAARRFAGRDGLKAGLAVWAGTPLLFYMYVAPPFSHACSAFAVALLVTVWLHVRATWSVRGAIALGLAGALAAMVREQDGVFVLGPAVDFALTAIKGQGKREKGQGTRQKEEGRSQNGKVAVAVAGGAAFFVGCLPQLFAYQALNGHPGPSSFVTRKLSWSAPHALQVMLDPEHGFFFWTPLAVLCIAGLLLLVLLGNADERRIGACALLMVSLQVYISGVVESWTVAGAFGQRRFVALTILLAMGLASLWREVSADRGDSGDGGNLIHARPDCLRQGYGESAGASAKAEGRAYGRRALGAATLLCVWWNVALIAEFGTQLMDRQRLELRRNVYHAFVTLPRLAPDLAYRYLVNRGSFYRPAHADDGR